MGKMGWAASVRSINTNDTMKEGTPRTGLQPSESVLAASGLVPSRTAMTPPKVTHIRVKPHIATLMADAYLIAYQELTRLREYSSIRPLTSEELKNFSMLVKSTVELSREERQQLTAFDAGDVDDQELFDLLSQAVERGPVEASGNGKTR